MDLKLHIDKQLEFNSGKNLLNKNVGKLFGFISGVEKIAGVLPRLDESSKDRLIDYTTQRVMEEFCRMNQYYSFNSEAISELREIYRKLFDQIAQSDYPKKNVKKISDAHYQKLQKWILGTNEFAVQAYSPEETKTEPVACSEYSSGFQLQVLNIEPHSLKEPVLDIGCGKMGTLVSEQNSMGIQTTGIDRFVDGLPDCRQADWLEYTYGKNKWGTIISNMSFSNHFRHHHFRTGGNYLKYAAKYMEILNALKTGGAFYYAPGLPFIEEFLDRSIYQIEIFETGNKELQAVKITRKG